MSHRENGGGADRFTAVTYSRKTDSPVFKHIIKCAVNINAQSDMECVVESSGTD